MTDILQPLIQQTILFLPKLASSLVLFLSFWILAILLQRIVRRFGRRSRLNLNVINLSVKLVFYATLIFGLVTALGTLGVNISALVASLGLTSFAIGLAFKDILSNLVSGVLILIYKPFRCDDLIVVSGFEGRVTEIDLRYTTLQSEDRRILIPNSSLFTNTITVVNATPSSVSPDS
jgi:small conductance mechanosensitive channel